MSDLARQFFCVHHFCPLSADMCQVLRSNIRVTRVFTSANKTTLRSSCNGVFAVCWALLSIPVVFLDSFSVELCRIFPSFTVSHTIRDQTGRETAQTSLHCRGAVRFQPSFVACRRKAMDMKTCGRRSTRIFDFVFHPSPYRVRLGRIVQGCVYIVRSCEGGARPDRQKKK